MKTKKTNNKVLNYDPNIRWSKHTVEVTFAQWQHFLVAKETMRGNTQGFSVIRSCIESLCEKFAEKGCAMRSHDGSVLEFEPDQSTSDEYEEMVVGARIVKHEKDNNPS